MHVRTTWACSPRGCVFRAAPVLAFACLFLCIGGASLGHPESDVQIAALTERIRESPDDASLYVRRGELRRLAREFRPAEADYARARALDPYLPSVDLCLGALREDEGSFQEARVALDRYLVIRATDPDGYAARARVLSKLGEHLDAARDWTRAIENDRRDPGPSPDWYHERARELIAAEDARVEARSAATECSLNEEACCAAEGGFAAHVRLVGTDRQERVRLSEPFAPEGPLVNENDHRLTGEALAALDEGIHRLHEPVSLQLYALDLERRLSRWDAAFARLDLIEAARGGGAAPDLVVRRGAILEEAGRGHEALAAYGMALAAIDHLPLSRRTTPAMAALEREARSAIARLDSRARPTAPGGGAAR